MVKPEKLGGRSGFTLVELLVSIAIFGILSSLVIANFRVAGQKTATQSFNQQLLELLQRAQGYAQEGRGVFRCADDNRNACTVATASLDCGSAPCETTPPSGGWGVHYTAVNQPAPQPASFKIYGDRQDAECASGLKAGTCSNSGITTCYSDDDCGYGGTCNLNPFGSLQLYRCLANPNRRFDYYYGQGGLNTTESRRCTRFFGVTVTSGLSCLTNGFQDDIVDSSALGTLTVPSNIFVKVYQGQQGGSFQLVSDVADFNFSLTTGKAYVGSGALLIYRDPTDIWNSSSILAKVCTSTVAAGPFHKILVYASGFVVDAGDNFTTC